MRSGFALTVSLSILLIGAKSCGTEFTPKLIDDVVLSNQPGYRDRSFNQDLATTESTCLDATSGESTHCYPVFATIDPNNTFVTRVVVQWGDRPSGNGEPSYDNVEPASHHYNNVPITQPVDWKANLPIRNNIIEGSLIDYQFRVFYKVHPDDTTEYSYWPGTRSLTIGPAQLSGATIVKGNTSFEPNILTVPMGESKTVNIRLSRPPTAPVIVRFYIDSPDVVQVTDDAGQSLTQLRFEPNQFVKAILVRRLRSTAGGEVLWAKASGWTHDAMSVR